MIKCDIATAYGLSNYYKYVKRVIILVKDISKINKNRSIITTKDAELIVRSLRDSVSSVMFISALASC